MEEVEPQNASAKPKISTLVFMDLESTGLPSELGKRNVHITEMCFVAVDRNSFETDKKLRALNKISLCVRPRFPVSPGAMMVTGLYNDLLEYQEEFDDSIPKLLEYFFRRLQKPICLLAHNGNRFDFPVLQAELNRLNFALGSDIVCADTLEAFRAICKLRKQTIEAAENAAKDQNGESNLGAASEPAAILEEDIESLLSEDLECFASIDESVHVSLANGQPTVSTTNGQLNVSTPTKRETHETKEFLSRSESEKTPQANIVTQNSHVNHKVRKRKILDPSYTPKSDYKRNNKRTNLSNSSVKRNLFVDPDPDQSDHEIHKITRFSLENLYNHFFHESPPNSHYAETDCISLSKVCQKINREFLEWIDENSVEFSSKDALW